MEISKHKNSQVMPLIKPYTGLRLPPDRYCLSAPNYRMSSHKAVKKVKSSSSSLCLPHINVWLLCVYTSINLFMPLLFYCIIGIHSHSHSLLLLFFFFFFFIFFFFYIYFTLWFDIKKIMWIHLICDSFTFMIICDFSTRPESR